MSAAGSTQDLGGTGEPLLEVFDLVKHHRVRAGPFSPARVVRAVDGVSFCVRRGETVGLVGESGSGKTTLARALLQLVEPDRGRVVYRPEGRPAIELGSLSSRELRAVRRELQIVFQDSRTSLNPRLPVREIVGEALRVHRLARGAALARRVAELLERVGLSARDADRYPHELSGGMRQRVGIARALALGPRFLVLDEPTSSLDLSLQAQVLNLVADLQEELGIACLLVAHDLAVVRCAADRVLVMHAGRIVEAGRVEDVFARPAHPHTRELLASIPAPWPRAGR